MPNMLVIGGTGMLKRAVLYWNKAGHNITLIARTTAVLEELKRQADRPNRLEIITADYTNSEEFLINLGDTKRFDIIIAWVHRNGYDMLQELCGGLTEQTELFHIKGSSAGNAGQSFTPNYPGCLYFEIILDFIYQNQLEQSRWLTNEEIAEGVINAVQQKKDRTIIGQLEPWELRP